MLAKLPAERAALLEAADLIEEYGHAKGYLGQKGEPMCAIGALEAATDGNMPVAFAGTDVLSLYLGNADVVDWNNAPERTKEEVVNTLRAAALQGL